MDNLVFVALIPGLSKMNVLEAFNEVPPLVKLLGFSNLKISTTVLALFMVAVRALDSH